MKLPKKTSERLAKEGRKEPAPGDALDRIAEELRRRGLKNPPPSECLPKPASET